MPRHAPTLLLAPLALTGCAGTPETGDRLERRGDEIVIAGQYFHTGTRVVLWTDPGGYDAYRAEQRFTEFDRGARTSTGEPPTPQRYNLRADNLSDDEIERLRGGGWDLPTLQEHVDQFVIHYDVCGDSRTCFRVLHDMRGLSIHFMIDIDGTIYQTLDVKERAWHATTSNTRSVGVEIANIGAYPPDDADTLDNWYETVEDRTRIVLPEARGDGGVRTPGFIGYASKREPISGVIQGQTLTQYDLTDEQYDALIKLTATLCTSLPRIRCDYPCDAEGELIPRKLPDDELASFSGLIGHYHIQTNKVDPGPAFNWDRVVEGARPLIKQAPRSHWRDSDDPAQHLAPAERE